MSKNISSIDELNEQQLLSIAEMEVGKAAILFTTPLSGTRKVASTMLEIVAETGVPYRLYRANINFTPHFRQLWQIKSIPALAIIEHGQLVDMVYALHSVSAIYEKLT